MAEVDISPGRGNEKEKKEKKRKNTNHRILAYNQQGGPGLHGGSCKTLLGRNEKIRKTHPGMVCHNYSPWQCRHGNKSLVNISTKIHTATSHPNRQKAANKQG